MDHSGSGYRQPGWDDCVADSEVPATMIVLGVVLIVLGLLFPQLAILTTLGIILLLIGIVLWVLGATGHPLAGRRYWY